MGSVDCNVVILRASPTWRISDVRRILVPVGGRGYHDEFRARLLGSLCRSGSREITFLRILPEPANQETCEKTQEDLSRVAQDEVSCHHQIKVIRANDVAEAITRHAADADLMILGLQRFNRRHKMFGEVTLRVARDTQCGMIMISRRG